MDNARKMEIMYRLIGEIEAIVEQMMTDESPPPEDATTWDIIFAATKDLQEAYKYKATNSHH